MTISWLRRQSVLFFSFALAFANNDIGWFRELRSQIESYKSIERFKNYNFLSDSLGGMNISRFSMRGGVLSRWDLRGRLAESADRVSDCQIDGRRTGILFDNGDLFVNDTLVDQNATGFKLAGERVAVLHSGRAAGDQDVLRIKEGKLNNPWVEVCKIPFIKMFQLENYEGSPRIGIVIRADDASDILQVQEGPLGHSWKTILRSSFINAFQMEHDRIGVLCVATDTFRLNDTLAYQSRDRLLVQQGEINKPFLCIRDHFHRDRMPFPDTLIRSFQMNGLRIVILEKIRKKDSVQDALLELKGPPAAGKWTTLIECPMIKAYQLTERGLGAVLKKVRGGDDSLLVGDGISWFHVIGAPMIRSFQLSGPRIGILLDKKIVLFPALDQPADTIAGKFGSFQLTGTGVMTLNGNEFQVETNGAVYTLTPEAIELRQRIPIDRALGSFDLDLPTHWSLRGKTTGAVFLTGESSAPLRETNYWMRINSDGLLMIESFPGYSMKGTVSASTLRDTITPGSPNIMLYDSLGGLSCMPLGWRAGESVRKSGHDLFFEVNPGQYLFISTFPPRNFNWEIGDERIFWHFGAYIYGFNHGYLTGGYIDSLSDPAVCSFNSNARPGHRNILFLQSNSTIWTHWNRSYQPRWPDTLRHRIAQAHRNGLSLMVYTSPFFFTKGSFDYPDYNDSVGEDIRGAVHYGENSDHYLAALARLINSTACPDGIYFDEIYPGNLPETYRVLKQVKTMLRAKVGPYHRLMFHCSGGLLTGGQPVFCPSAETYADFLTSGEQVNYSDKFYTDFYYRRRISGYNISNSVGYICNWQSYTPLSLGSLPPDSLAPGQLFSSHFMKYRVRIQNLKTIRVNARVPMWQRMYPEDPLSLYHPQPLKKWFIDDFGPYLDWYPRNAGQYPVVIPQFDRLPPDGSPDADHYVTIVPFPAGKTYAPGDKCTIRWQSRGVDHVTIEYSTAADPRFKMIARQLKSSPSSPPADSLSWIVPARTRQDYFIRIIGYDKDNAFIGIDVSAVPRTAVIPTIPTPSPRR